ncbi:MAG: hypothetical protein ACKVZ0_18170 [Gemmatimonadales bacterium]
MTFRRRLAADFRIERELGRGGVAIVYRAVDLRHDRPVAIKVIYPQIGPIRGWGTTLALSTR